MAKKSVNGYKSCPQCGTNFTCGIAEGGQTCWCFDLPNVVPVDEETACLCPDCLQKHIQNQLLITEQKAED